MSTSSIARRIAEHGQAARRFAALALAALAVAAALPAHAFQKTALADGGFEYFFAAPSLDIRGAGDLDLTGLSFIEGVTGGFRVGASFDLDWLGSENAWLAYPASTWSGVDTTQRTLSIVAGGDMRFGPAVQISLPGGAFSLTAGESLILGETTTIDVGGSGGSVIGNPGLAVQPAPPSGGVILVSGSSGATINLVPVLGNPGFASAPGGAVVGHIVGSDYNGLYPVTTLTLNRVYMRDGNPLVLLSPIPEPAAAVLMLSGLLSLAGFVRRRQAT